MAVSSARGPVIPIFVVLPHAEARGSALGTALAPLSLASQRACPQAADLYYSSAKGTALVALTFDPRLLTVDMLTELAAEAARGGAAVVDAGRLPARARQRFHEEYLPLFDVRRGGLASFEAALAALADHLGSALPDSPPRVEVRFRRGDAWQIARVRSMTREGISIATCTPPRRGDAVELEIAAPDLTLVARATVTGVAMGDTAVALGATGFGARFLPASEDERDKIAALLRLVGGEKLRALEPPPRRRAARYPVRWPVHIRSPRGRLSRSALDVSRHGMFVGCEVDSLPADGNLHLTVPVDDRGTPILATARVARAIPDEMAKHRGLSSGVGIEITAISQRDEQRFGAFVARVGRRCEREVLVGASPGRVLELTAALSAAGYCVTGVSDAASLVARAAASPRVPDLAIIDSSLASESPRAIQAARRQLAVRLVPLMQIDGDAAEVARETVDDALLAG